MTTLLVLYRAPEGGADALATFERRYRDEHLPLVAQTPGPARDARLAGRRRRSAARPTSSLAAAMDFDDRAALDAGLRSDPMRAAGRILREIAPGLATFLVLEDAPDLLAGVRSAARPPWILSAAVTDRRVDPPIRRCTSRCRRPAADGPVDGVALVVARSAARCSTPSTSR